MGANKLIDGGSERRLRGDCHGLGSSRDLPRKPACRIVGFDVELALEMGLQEVVLLKRFSLAAAGGGSTHPKPVGVLAQLVDGNRPPCEDPGPIMVAAGQLLLTKPNDRVESHPLKTLLLHLEPVCPALLGKRQIAQQAIPVEVQGLTEGGAASLLDQHLKARNVAANRPGLERDGVGAAQNHVLAEDTAQARQGLPQVLARLRFNVSAPQQSHQFLAAVGRGMGRGQICQQSCVLLAGQLNWTAAASQLKAAEESNTKSRRALAAH